MAVKNTTSGSGATPSSQLPSLSMGPGRLFVYSQFCAKRASLPEDTSLAGQTALVTGANGGIGLAAAGMLLDLGVSRLIIAVRSQTKGDEAVKALRQKHPRASSSATIDVWTLDLASYDSIQAFAGRASSQSELPRFDIAILNAGLMNYTFLKTEATGHEATLQVNVLSTMFLASLLLPTMKARNVPLGKPGRMTVVGSGTAMHAGVPQLAAGVGNGYEPGDILRSFDDPGTYSVTEQYPGTKLVLQLLVDKLAREYVDAEHVVVNCSDPGFTKDTGLHRTVKGVVGSGVEAVKNMTGRSLEDAASKEIDAVVGDGPGKGKDTHGCFLMDWKIYPFGQFYYTPQRKEVQERLWDEVMREFAFAGLEDTLRLLSK